MTIQILNVRNVETAGKSELLAYCDRRINAGQGATLVPINPIKVIKARSRPEFQEMIDAADWVFADAVGIKWASRILYGQKIELLPGWQIMLALVEQAAALNQSVYFLGTTDQILQEAIGILQQRHPGLRVAGMHDGFFPPEQQPEVFARVADANPDYVFVAMGEYKQELVIEELRKLHPSAVYQGVGGSLDLVAGKQPMPPDWIRRNHLEWLFRAVRQPFRLPRMKAIPIFAVLVLLAKLRLCKNA